MINCGGGPQGDVLFGDLQGVIRDVREINRWGEGLNAVLRGRGHQGGAQINRKVLAKRPRERIALGRLGLIERSEVGGELLGQPGVLVLTSAPPVNLN
ncbi:hypothetical protein IWQ60_010449 [Tieghemiomyces parasiticus]|uniref:Uncharacterized protein n=1 Tax=Tieghemiomyces parasiticus TaxID=78921 RepID=A0A9W8DNJ7_9FUNG|nr:hypothetical protein IWQ60_010449 [Tieghemiomyces parasiticus]